MKNSEIDNERGTLIPLATFSAQQVISGVLPGATSELCKTSVPPPHKPLLLVEAIQIALCERPNIRSGWAGIRGKQAGIEESIAAFFPTINATLSTTNSQVEYPERGGASTKDNNRSGGLSLNYRLLDFGGRQAKTNSARMGLEAEAASYNQTLQKMVNEVSQAYYDTVVAQATVDARNRAYFIAQRILEITNQRLDRGVSARGDVLQAEAAFIRAKLEHTRATGSLEQSQASLMHALGVKTDSFVKVEAIEETQGAYVLNPLEHYLEEAKRQHPALVALRAQIDNVRSQIVTTLSDNLPSLNLAVNYFRNGNVTPGYVASSGRSNTLTMNMIVNIPIYDGQANLSRQNILAAQVDEKSADLAQMEQDISLDVTKSFNEARNTMIRQWEAWELLVTSRKLMESAETRYSLGITDLLEVENVATTLISAEISYIRDKTDWKLARIKLLNALGRMGFRIP